MNQPPNQPPPGGYTPGVYPGFQDPAAPQGVHHHHVHGGPAMMVSATDFEQMRRILEVASQDGDRMYTEFMQRGLPEAATAVGHLTAMIMRARHAMHI